MATPRIVFLHGPVASGKLSIAQELATLTGLPLFHNHLTVDLLLAVFPFGDPAFVRLREAIWLEVMTAAVGQGGSLIFTFAPERTVSAEFPTTLERRIAERGGAVRFVEVRCAEEEIERRLAAPSRAAHRKLTSLAAYRELKSQGAFEYPPIRADCVVDSDKQAPAEAAASIARALNLGGQANGGAS